MSITVCKSKSKSKREKGVSSQRNFDAALLGALQVNLLLLTEFIM